MPTVRELLGAIAAQGAAGGFVVSAGEFTEPAKEFVKGRNIELIDGQNIAAMISEDENPNSKTKRLPTTPECPICGANMVIRIAKKGANPGNHFWGCSQFAKTRCRGTISV